MPEVKQILYGHKELTELMLKDRGISSGHWQIYITFRLTGANIAVDAGEVKPAAITFIEAIGLHQVDEPTPLSVDASKIEPKRTVRSPKSAASPPSR